MAGTIAGNFADILLIYAEAINMAGSGPTQLAVDRLNLIISRANEGTGDEAAATLVMSQAEFDKKVIDERSYELCFENDYLLPIPALDAKAIGQNAGYE
jgi:starch-binding outer membrane protein, SusD/RagB family